MPHMNVYLKSVDLNDVYNLTCTQIVCLAHL